MQDVQVPWCSEWTTCHSRPRRRSPGVLISQSHKITTTTHGESPQLVSNRALFEGKFEKLHASRHSNTKLIHGACAHWSTAGYSHLGPKWTIPDDYDISLVQVHLWRVPRAKFQESVMSHYPFSDSLNSASYQSCTGKEDIASAAPRSLFRITWFGVLRSCSMYTRTKDQQTTGKTCKPQAAPPPWCTCVAAETTLRWGNVATNSLGRRLQIGILGRERRDHMYILIIA